MDSDRLTLIRVYDAWGYWLTAKIAGDHRGVTAPEALELFVAAVSVDVDRAAVRMERAHSILRHAQRVEIDVLSTPEDPAGAYDFWHVSETLGSEALKRFNAQISSSICECPHLPSPSEDTAPDPSGSQQIRKGPDA